MVKTVAFHLSKLFQKHPNDLKWHTNIYKISYCTRICRYTTDRNTIIIIIANNTLYSTISSSTHHVCSAFFCRDADSTMHGHGWCVLPNRHAHESCDICHSRLLNKENRRAHTNDVTRSAELTRKAGWEMNARFMVFLLTTGTLAQFARSIECVEDTNEI